MAGSIISSLYLLGVTVKSTTLIASLAIIVLGLCGVESIAQVPAKTSVSGGDKVIYHIDDAELQATKALRNIRNHLDIAPDTEIVVVTHANGVDMLMSGAKDQKNPDISWEALVGALRSRGVRFEVCEITLGLRNLSKDVFLLDAEFTPSGVLRIGRLQYREGYAYIRP